MMDNKKIALNAVCTAVVAGIATKVIFGEYANVRYFGVNMDSAVAVGLGCGTGSLVSDLTSDLVIKRLGLNNQIMNGSVFGAKIAVGAVSSATILYFGGLPIENLLPALAVGAGSKLGGDYINDKVFDPRTGFLPLF